MQGISLTPIGRVRSPWTEPGQPPRQGPEAGAELVIELDPAWAEGLSGLSPGRWLWVICHFHRAGPARTMIHPRQDPSRPLTGVFNTRAPIRPCPLGLTLVRLVAVEGTRLTVRGLEAIDGTPVLDLKPYVPGIDQPRDEA